MIRYELGRQAAMTKLSSNKTVRRIRVRGGNFKFRALRLDTGNFSWGSEAVTRKTRVLDVVYNASNNELVRTQTLVKNAIIQVDAAPFRQWYNQHYGVDIGKKKKVVPGKKEEVQFIPNSRFKGMLRYFPCLGRLSCSSGLLLGCAMFIRMLTLPRRIRRLASTWLRRLRRGRRVWSWTLT